METLGVPCFLGGMSRGLLGRNHPLHIRQNRSAALKKADVVVLAGGLSLFFPSSPTLPVLFPSEVFLCTYPFLSLRPLSKPEYANSPRTAALCCDPASPRGSIHCGHLLYLTQTILYSVSHMTGVPYQSCSVQLCTA